MDRGETLALWREGKDEWECWRRGVEEKKAALEQAGKWAVDWYGEGRNDETKGWLEEASADFSESHFADDADFAGVAFPGPANFEGSRFAGGADFTGAKFGGNASFNNVRSKNGTFTGTEFRGFACFSKIQFDGEANFKSAKFHKSSDFEPGARFRQAKFSGGVTFAGAEFTGAAEFLKAGFASASFDGCVFRGDAKFTFAEFTGEASFAKTHFAGSLAGFGSAVFRARPRFENTQFGRSQAELAISGACIADFEAARFENGACFARAWFTGGCEFKDAQFGGPAVFNGAQFVLPAAFAPAAFSDSCSFQDANFEREADFTGSAFQGECAFNRAKFGEHARFDQARFGGPALFESAEFGGEASFRGVTAEAVVAFGGAKCVAAPNVEGGTFAVEPALGNLVKIRPRRRLFKGAGDGDPARPLFSLLRRSRQEAGTAEPEISQPAWPQEEPAGDEAQAQPAEHRAAAPFVANRHPAAAGGSAWPVLRVLMVWAFTVALFVPFYLNQRPAVSSGAATAETAGFTAEFAALAYHATLGAGPCINGNSLPAGEALVLSAKNALVFVPWESEHVIHRVYGCLYGLEEGKPAIPYAVSLGALLQAFLSLMLLASAVQALRRSR